jgi:uncharacterized membrane protein
LVVADSAAAVGDFEEEEEALAAAAPPDGGDVSLARILRHLSSSRLRVGRAFPPATLAAIENAIRETEGGYEGEIVFAIEAALDTASLLRGQTAKERALEVFSELRVWDTEHNNGVLIYVLIADRDVEVLADRGIHERTGKQAWSEICREMETFFGSEQYLAGSLAGIRAVARHLSRYFGPPGGRRNEISDEPRIS